MQKLLLALSVVLSACGGGGGSASAPAPAQAVAVESALPVYILWGQSNMDGQASDPALLPASLQGSQLAVIYSNGHWLPLAPTGAYQANGTGFGPEISFAAQKGAVGIVKFARGGTTLAVDWSGPTLQSALAELAAATASRPLRIKGLLWMQGETDANNVADGAAYAGNFRALASTVRTAVGDPALPIVACRVNPPLTFPARDAVRQAQMNPGVANYRWMDCDAIPKYDDLHFTSEGQIELGNLFAAAL